MLNLLAVGLGGFLGAIARYGMTELVLKLWKVSFPLGTLVVNIIGCALLGVVIALGETPGRFSDPVRLFIVIGVLGSFTTFSTFSYEAMELVRNGSMGLAALYLLASVGVGIGVFALARLAARALT